MRIDRNTEFKFLQLEGGIDKDVIKNIENAKNYLNESASKKLQAIIKDNTGKEIKYGTPEGCDTIFDDFNHVVALFNCSNFPQSFLMMA
jgi:hypothetical protein